MIGNSECLKMSVKFRKYLARQHLLFFCLICVLRCTLEYFTYTPWASMMVGGSRTVLKEYPRPRSALKIFDVLG